ncbi:MAG: GTP-binding protein, partial [Desulfobacteraceae bacterium]
MDVFIVSGFLGAGKTTLIKHLLTSNIQEVGKVALIVNEVGNIGIDGTLLSGKNVDMMEITSGCICCTLKTDFSRAIQEIHDRVSPDFLVVEATGVAQPGDILDTLYEPPANKYSRIRHLVTVVDADFFKAKDMFGPFYDNQIRCADT